MHRGDPAIECEQGEIAVFASLAECGVVQVDIGIGEQTGVRRPHCCRVLEPPREVTEGADAAPTRTPVQAIGLVAPPHGAVGADRHESDAGSAGGAEECVVEATARGVVGRERGPPVGRPVTHKAILNHG